MRHFVIAYHTVLWIMADWFMARRSISEAELRRNFRKALDEAGMNAAEAARAAGLPSANAVYNFLNGRTKNLSGDTLSRLAKVVPGVSLAMIGVSSGSLQEIGTRAVQVKSAAQAGVFRRSFDLPLEEQYEIAVPVTPAQRAAGAYGVLVRAPGFERVFRDGTVAVVLPLNRWEGTLTTGSIVVLDRMVDKKVEVTVREVIVEKGIAYLWPRSAHPAHQAPVEMPWPNDGSKTWRLPSGERYGLAGIVAGVWQPFLER